MNIFKITIFLCLSLNIATFAWADVERVPNSIEQDSYKVVNDKQLHAIQLINIVGALSNTQTSNESEKESTQYAYDGFIARFQGIREDRQNDERKEIKADSKTLMSYSLRFDQLTKDIENFLK